MSEDYALGVLPLSAMKRKPPTKSGFHEDGGIENGLQGSSKISTFTHGPNGEINYRRTNHYGGDDYGGDE